MAHKLQIILVLLVYSSYYQQLYAFLNLTQSLCAFNDPIKSCKCYFDGQKFVANCARTELDDLPATKLLPTNIDNLALDVSHNNLHELHWDDDKFQSKSLRFFDGSRNSIRNFPTKFLQALPHLTYLDLSYNQITHLALTEDTFATTTSLHHLDLRFNALAHLPAHIFKPLHNLRFLDLGYNDLGSQLRKYSSLNSSGLGFNENLHTLRLDAINLTRLSRLYFDNLTGLAHLTLSDNGLEQVPLMPAELESLDLSGNEFVSLAARNLAYTQLRILRLNRLRSLERIENYAFYNLLSLEELEIQYCGKLRQLNDLAFGVILDQQIKNLTRLVLRGNGIRSINDTYFHLFNELQEVDLSENPWICDCGITWFQMVRLRLINPRNMRCMVPKRLRNHEILELNDRLLPRCNIKINIHYQKALLTVICVLIALLLILILYLFYFVPFKGNKSNRFIGTESPYSNITLRDDSSL